MMEEKDYSLIFCRRTVDEDSASNLSTGRQILLGMKKRGFGCGKWNGFGGKLEPNESIEQCAARELAEESGLTAVPASLKRMGYLVFKMQEAQKILRVHVFETWSFAGSAADTEEMAPRWFSEADIPYENMWPDDQHWLPLLLRGQAFVGRFDYGDEDSLLSFDVALQ